MMVWLSAAFTLLILGFLLLHVLVNGIPHLLRPGLFSTQWTTQNQSMFPAIINTVIFVFFSLMVAVPLGVFTAIYLVEYANRGNKLVGIVRMMAETLAGIPSIVYGLFGFMMFRNFMGWGRSLLAGGFTLAIMILPVIIRTTEESLKAVPDNYREGSFGLGAGRLRTVFRIVLPSAIPGIVAGVILAVGRVVGETAALIFTAGTMPHVIDSPTASGRTLSLHIYSNIMEATNDDVAYATAVVLLLLVIGINALSYGLAKISTKGRRK
ncbi:MAG: phosphate ABC transporter permease PstA [Oscillospiraceae bacterium]|nr:phosphate ABC transporter permease PstA [Oscillospiraceae bacterium]